MRLSHTVSEIFSVKYWRDLEFWVRVIQGHWKWYHSKDGYGFLFAFHSNYDCIYSRFDTIHEHDGVRQTDRHRMTA